MREWCVFDVMLIWICFCIVAVCQVWHPARVAPLAPLWGCYHPPRSAPIRCTCHRVISRSLCRPWRMRSRPAPWPPPSSPSAPARLTPSGPLATSLVSGLISSHLSLLIRAYRSFQACRCLPATSATNCTLINWRNGPIHPNTTLTVCSLSPWPEEPMVLI